MAIGKVGSFATVEPALVDFGSMAERNIDKIKAEEQAKAAAKAKAGAEREKDYKPLDPLTLTTLDGVDKLFGEMGQALYNDVNYNFVDYVNTGNFESKMKSEDARYAYKALERATTSSKDGVVKLTDANYIKGKNLDAVKEHLEYMQTLDKEGKLKREGRNVVVNRGDDNYINVESVIPRLLILPDEFNYQGFIKDVKSNTAASTTTTGNYNFNVTREDIMSPQSANQRAFIRNSVIEKSFNDSALYEYARKKGLKDEFGLTKTSGFTDDEKKEWVEQTTQDIINSFPSKEDKKFGAPKSDGGGDKEDIITGNVVPLGQKVEGDVKDVASKLKGRPVYSTKNKSGIPIAGVVVSHIYSTGGSDPGIYFQTTDPTTTSFGGSGGKTPGYQWVTPQSSNYDAYVNDAIKILGVANKSELGKKLRGESQQINTSQYNN